MAHHGESVRVTSAEIVARGNSVSGFDLLATFRYYSGKKMHVFR